MQRCSHKACSVLEKKIFKGFSHTNAQGSELDLAVKGQTSKYDNSLSNFGRHPVPDDSCKGSAPRRTRFWRRFLKVFTIYGRAGGHLGQRTATILAIFRSPTLRRLHMKFEQNWLSGFRREVV